MYSFITSKSSNIQSTENIPLSIDSQQLSFILSLSKSNISNIDKKLPPYVEHLVKQLKW